MSSIIRNVTIQGDLITLGQLIKHLGFISFGAEAKAFLATAAILVNGEAEDRRGRKLHPGDVIEFVGVESVRLESATA